jgi:predicted unusual protein kinase regulating ubiquinone biosynthesis (AarF/ABC1/UbiB family)
MSSQSCFVAVHTVLWGVEMSGPAYIKLMQWASTRRDIFPENLCRR